MGDKLKMCRMEVVVVVVVVVVGRIPIGSWTLGRRRRPSGPMSGLFLGLWFIPSASLSFSSQRVGGTTYSEMGAGLLFPFSMERARGPGEYWLSGAEEETCMASGLWVLVGRLLFLQRSFGPHPKRRKEASERVVSPLLRFTGI